MLNKISCIKVVRILTAHFQQSGNSDYPKPELPERVGQNVASSENTNVVMNQEQLPVANQENQYDQELPVQTMYIFSIEFFFYRKSKPQSSIFNVV